ncbi:MAG TPA: hypothetical protein VFI40_12710 [Nocardioides sp.]|nr:hypothetical protein [Nocardioides sp.]
MTTLETRTPRRRDQPLVMCALVAAVVVAGYLAYFQLMTHTVPHLYGHWPTGFIGLLQFLVEVSPYALFAVVLLAWGRSLRRRLAGAVCALVAGVADWGIQYAFDKLIYERGHFTQTNARVFDWTMTLLIPTLVALAWGLARRSGRAWPVGVLVAPALAWARHMLQFHNSDFQSWEFHHGQWWVVRLEFIAPMVAACLVCWLIEVATGTSEMRSSA